MGERNNVCGTSLKQRPPPPNNNKQTNAFPVCDVLKCFLWTHSAVTFKWGEEEKRRVSARFSDGVLLSAAAPLCALGLIREMHSQVRILAADASGVCQVDTACIHFPPPPPPPATSFSLWRDPPHRDLGGRFPLGLRPDGVTSQVCHLPGRCGSSGQTKPSDSSVAPPSPREYLSAPLPPAFLWNKWFSVADGWGTRAGCVGSCVIHRQSHNGFTAVVVVAAASCSVLATFVFRHFDFLFIYLFFALLCVFFSFPPLLFKVDFCKWMFIPETSERDVFLRSFETYFGVDGMFGENQFECTIKNHSLWFFASTPQCSSESVGFCLMLGCTVWWTLL